MLIQETSFEKRRTERLNLSGVLYRSVEPGVVAVDAQRNVTAFNRAAERITGLQAEAVLGRKIVELPTPLQQTIEETFASGKPVTDRTVVLFPDGEEKAAVHTNTSLCASASGQPLVVLAVFHDLDSARKLERRVRRLERLASIGTLSAGVAHEIKTRRTAVPSLKKIYRRRVRGQRFRHGKQDFECRTFVDFALDLDPASMLLNNPGRNCQAEAGPFRFGGLERNEEVSGQFRRNA